MQSPSNNTSGIKVPFLASFREVPRDIRHQQFAIFRAADAVFREFGFEVEMLWRDGPDRDVTPMEWRMLLIEDALAVQSCAALVAITGLPSRGGIAALLEVARVHRRAQILFSWPDSVPIDAAGIVLTQRVLPTGEELKREIGSLLELVGPALREASTTAVDPRTRSALQADARPARLERLRHIHQPVALSLEQLSQRSGLSTQRLRAFELLPWEFLMLSQADIEALAESLDVPYRTLLAESDVDAGMARRLAQVQHAAYARDTRFRVLARVLQMLHTRTNDPLAEFNPATISYMFRKAESDAKPGGAD